MKNDVGRMSSLYGHSAQNLDHCCHVKVLHAARSVYFVQCNNVYRNGAMVVGRTSASVLRKVAVLDTRPEKYKTC